MKRWISALLMSCLLLTAGEADKTEKEPPPKTPPPKEEKVEKEDPVVYVTKTGKKYHLGSCDYLKRSKIETTLKEAKKKYTACSVCKPPE